MLNYSMVYCLSCENIVRRDLADSIFKTGYYKIMYPLAVCKDCEQASAIAEIVLGSEEISCSIYADNIDLRVEGYRYSM
jgi:hypothetical protein